MCVWKKKLHKLFRDIQLNESTAANYRATAYFGRLCCDWILSQCLLINGGFFPPLTLKYVLKPCPACSRKYNDHYYVDDQAWARKIIPSLMTKMTGALIIAVLFSLMTTFQNCPVVEQQRISMVASFNWRYICEDGWSKPRQEYSYRTVEPDSCWQKTSKHESAV